MPELLCADLLVDISLEQTYLICLGHHMKTPLTKQLLESIVAEEMQKIQDDLCDKKGKHELGKHSKLIGTGLRLCDKKTHNAFYVITKIMKKGSEFFILADAEGKKHAINAKDLLQSYRLDENEK